MDSTGCSPRARAICNCEGAAAAAFTRAAELCGHPLVRDAFKHFADAMVFARLVEKKIGAKRKALRAVLGEGVVREDDHFCVGRSVRYQRSQNAETRAMFQLKIQHEDIP